MTRLRLTDRVAIILAILTIAQAIPWVVIFAGMSDWWGFDTGIGPVSTIPAGILALVAAFLVFRPLKVH